MIVEHTELAHMEGEQIGGLRHILILCLPLSAEPSHEIIGNPFSFRAVAAALEKLHEPVEWIVGRIKALGHIEETLDLRHFEPLPDKLLKQCRLGLLFPMFADKADDCAAAFLIDRAVVFHNTEELQVRRRQLGPGWLARCAEHEILEDARRCKPDLHGEEKRLHRVARRLPAPQIHWKNVVDDRFQLSLDKADTDLPVAVGEQLHGGGSILDRDIIAFRKNIDQKTGLRGHGNCGGVIIGRRRREGAPNLEPVRQHPL